MQAEDIPDLWIVSERAAEDKIQINVKAAEKMAKLYGGLKTFGYEGHNLEVYLVHLLFCMFADMI